MVKNRGVVFRGYKINIETIGRCLLISFSIPHRVPLLHSLPPFTQIPLYFFFFLLLQHLYLPSLELSPSRLHSLNLKDYVTSTIPQAVVPNHSKFLLIISSSTQSHPKPHSIYESIRACALARKQDFNTMKVFRTR